MNEVYNVSWDEVEKGVRSNNPTFSLAFFVSNSADGYQF